MIDAISPISGVGRRVGIVGIMVVVAALLAGCRTVEKTCTDLPADLCDSSIAAAVRGLPSAIASRSLSAAFVEAGDPSDPTLCKTWGLCVQVSAVWVVVLTYGDEKWPVLVMRSQPGDPLEPAKPFEEWSPSG